MRPKTIVTGMIVVFSFLFLISLVLASIGVAYYLLDVPDQKNKNVAEAAKIKIKGKAPAALEPSGKQKQSDKEGPLGMKFVALPKATFYMGGGGRKAAKKTAVKEDFEIAICTVTQGQWQEVMGTNPSLCSRDGKGKDSVKDIKDEDLKHFPVEMVSWDDAQAFINNLNEKEKRNGYHYRLPSETEWEYACRGGATSEEECSYDFYFAKPTNDLSSKEANFNGNVPFGKADKGPYLGRTTKVGSYAPNKLGLYDMHGNVWQWCEDLREKGAPSERGSGAASWQLQRQRLRGGPQGVRADGLPGPRPRLPSCPSSGPVAGPDRSGEISRRNHVKHRPIECVATRLDSVTTSERVAKPRGAMRAPIEIRGEPRDVLEIHLFSDHACDAARRPTLPQVFLHRSPYAQILHRIHPAANGTKASFEMIAVPGGIFQMGSPVTEKGRKEHEGPQHPVTIKPLWVGKCEVTWGEYDLYWEKKANEKSPMTELDKKADAITRPSKANHHDIDWGYGRGKNQPVIAIHIHSAMEYCRWLSEKTGKIYRLPTEAEWEWACRAGTTTAYSFGDDPAKLGDHAWFESNSNDMPHPVALKKPNAWGLHDMHGNVAEYCLDHYDAKFYATLPTDKPTLMPLKLPSNRRYSYVARGGSWIDPAERCRSAERAYSIPDWQKKDPQAPQSIWWNNADWVGFRVVRAVEEGEALKGMRSKITKESPN